MKQHALQMSLLFDYYLLSEKQRVCFFDLYYNQDLSPERNCVGARHHASAGVHDSAQPGGKRRSASLGERVSGCIARDRRTAKALEVTRRWRASTAQSIPEAREAAQGHPARKRKA